MIKLCVCYIVSGLSSIFLQIVDPIVKQSAESLQSFILQILTMLVSLVTATFGFIIALRVNKVKKDVTEVKTGLGGVHIEVEQLKKNTDGALKEMIDVKEQLSEQLGIQKGIDKSKQLHDEQSKKEEDANIAKGVLLGTEAAEAKQAILPASAAPTDVKIVNKESDPPQKSR